MKASAKYLKTSLLIVLMIIFAVAAYAQSITDVTIEKNSTFARLEVAVTCFGCATADATLVVHHPYIKSLNYYMDRAYEIRWLVDGKFFAMNKVEVPAIPGKVYTAIVKDKRTLKWGAATYKVPLLKPIMIAPYMVTDPIRN